MFKEHTVINTPQSDTIIWKYMDLWKFLDLIDNSRLFFCQAKQLEDKLDGRIPINYINKLDEKHPIKEVDKFAQTVLKWTHYVNCWSKEENETYPLWKVYSDYKTAVAIKSTIGHLIESISNDTKEQYIGQVNYVTPKHNYAFHGNTFQFFYEKRDYFAFEKEVRIISILPHKEAKDLIGLPTGCHVQINSNLLIDEIRLAPLANENFKNLIALKLEALKLDIPITFSEI
jgi:hypothetical protein